MLAPKPMATLLSWSPLLWSPLPWSPLFKRGVRRPASVFLTLCLGLGLGLLSACTHAGTLEGQTFTAPDRFQWLAPEPEHWRLQENQRGPFQTRVSYYSPQSHAELFVHALPLPRGAQNLPLDVLAELQFMQLMGQRGGLPDLEHELRIVLDEREAVGLVGSRYDRPLTEECALIVARSQGFLMRVGYCAPPEHFEQQASAFEQLLRHFKLLLPGPFDPMLLESIPSGAPGPSPGQWRGLPSTRQPSTPVSKEESRRW